MRDGIPRHFHTCSRVAILGNRWRSGNADVSAVQDRGHVVVFQPTALEVHREAARWFWDQEVFDFVALLCGGPFGAMRPEWAIRRPAH